MKHRMLKRAIVLLLTLAMLITGSGAAVFAESLNEGFAGDASEPAVTEQAQEAEADGVTVSDEASEEQAAEAGEAETSDAAEAAPADDSAEPDAAADAGSDSAAQAEASDADDDAEPIDYVEGAEPEEASDQAAQPLTAKDWEAKLPDRISDDAREAMAQVAESQKDSDIALYKAFANADSVENGDAAFAMFVLEYANVLGVRKAIGDDSKGTVKVGDIEIPLDADSEAWVKALKDADLYSETGDDSKPQKGDIAFVKGMAAVVTDAAEDGSYTLYGQKDAKDSAVSEFSTGADTDKIEGFVSLKAIAADKIADEETVEAAEEVKTEAEENSDDAKAEDAEEAKDGDKKEAEDEDAAKAKDAADAEADAKAEAEARIIEENLTDKTVEAKITSAPGVGGKLRSLVTSTKGAEITLSGKMPEGATVKAYPVSVNIPGETVLTAYDITIYVPELDENGEPTGKQAEWQPDGSINVSINDKALKDMEGRVGIYHMEDKNAEAEFVQNGNVGEDGVMFRAEQFSIYVVTEKEPTPVVTYEFTYGSESNGTKKTFEVVVPEGEQLLEPATPSDPKLGKFVAWYWDEDLTDEVHFDYAAAVTATDAPRTVKVYGKFDGKKYLSFMSLPMEDGDRRTFETFVLEPDETTFDISEVNTYGAPVNHKFRGWAEGESVKSTIASDPYNNDLRHTSTGNQYYTLDETITGIDQSMTFYPVVKDGIWITFDADPDNNTGGLVDGKRTKKVMAAEDETWEDVYKQIKTVAAEGYELDKWVEDGSDDKFDFNSSTVGSDKNSYTFDAKWTPKNDVNVTFMYWKEDVEPELYTLIKTENKTFTAGQQIDLTDTSQVGDCAAKIAADGEFLKNDADMEFFYLAELTSGDGTTDPSKEGVENHSKYINVKGDGSTVINVWYDRKIVKLTFQDCYTTLVRLGEPLADVWPTKDRNGRDLTGFKLNNSLNALYIYPTASSMVLGGLTNEDGNINLNASEYKDGNNETHFIQPEDYYTSTKTAYQAVKTLPKITGTPSNTAQHWYEDTTQEASANSVNYAADNNPDKSFKTSAGQIVTREVDGYRIDYTTVYNKQGGRNYVSVSSRYADGAEKQLVVKVKNYTFKVYYKANKYAVALFDGEQMLARNDGVKFKTPLDADWVTISGHKLDDLLAVDSNGVPTAEAEALARQIYGKKAPADYMQFMGWYIDRDFAATDRTYSVSGKTMPSADLNLYAHWEPRTVSVKVDKGTRSGQHETPPTVNPSDIHAGTQILDYENTSEHKFYAHANTLADYLADGWMNPTWKNHVFLGWEYRSKTAYGSDEWTEWKNVTNWNDTVDHDTQLRGLWQDMTPFSVHYYVDGREVTLDTASYLNGGTVILQGYDKTDNSGNVFRGWKVRGGDGTLLEPGENQTINGGDLFLDGVFEPGSVNPGEEPALYVFMIWEPNGASSNFKSWGDDPARTERTALTNNLANYYGETTNTGGEWKVFYQEIIYSGDPLTTPPSVPASLVDGEGKFQGWYENAGLTKRFDNFGVVDTPHSTILYAGFKNSFKVTYHTISGPVLEVQNYTWDGQDQLNTGTVGSSYKYTDTTKNKTFKVVEWTTYNVNNRCLSEDEIKAEDPSAKFYKCGVASTEKVTHNMDLYPVMVEGYTLSFDTDGGSYIEPEVYRVNEPTEAPDVPTKGAQGQFEWKGWYQEAPHDNTEHHPFHWGDTISQDTTVYGWFDDLSEQQEITASVWMQNADGETYSFAGSATVASDDTELANNKQPINTLFTLSDSNRQDLEGSGKPIGNLLGADGRAYFEYNASKGNTSVMVTKDKDENVLNLYYDRKHFDMVFNAGNGRFDTNKANASGTELSNSNKTYTIHNVWIDKDISDVWPDASYIVDPSNNAFVSWQAASDTSKTYKVEDTATKEIAVAGGMTATNPTATYNAQYESTQPSAVASPTGDETITYGDRNYKIVINRYVGDKLYQEVKTVNYDQYVNATNGYQRLFTKTAETPQSGYVTENSYNTPNMALIKSAPDAAFGDYELDESKMSASENTNSSSDRDIYQYSYKYIYNNGTTGSRCTDSAAPVRTDTAYHWYQDKPLYFSVYSGLGDYYHDYLLYIKDEYGYHWTETQGLVLNNSDGTEYVGPSKSNTIYYSVRSIGYNWVAGHYNGLSGNAKSQSYSTFTNYTSSLPATGNGSHSSTYVTEYRRQVTEYTPGTVVLTYHYTEKPDPAPAQHSVTRSYGNSTDNAGSFAEGAVVKASDLGTADVAAHTADIQAYFGDTYITEHPYSSYSFSGWYLDETRTTKIPSDGMVMPGNDVTVYAGWIDETQTSDSKVTVTTLVAGSRTNFSRAVGTVFGNFNIPVTAASGELNQDGRSGDVLLGWYRENDEYRTVIQPTEPITEDITVRPLILQAGETFDIIYDMNGIPATDNPIYGQHVNVVDGKYKTDQGYYPGANATVASVDSSKLNFASKPSYAQFYCWNTKADGTGDSYFPDETVRMPADGDLTLYAMYSPYMNTSLVYELGYEDAPDISESARTVVFKDYKDEYRAAHELYTNSTYSVETQYSGETEPYYERLLFDGKTIGIVRPGYTFLGWLDKASTAEYSAANADQKEAMLLHYEDKIRANAPTVGEDGQLEKEYLVAQWKQDVLKVNVYTAAHGQWSTNAELQKQVDYTKATKDKVINLAAGDGTAENQGTGHTFATGSDIGYVPTTDYPIFGLAAVNGTVVSSVKYQEKADHSGYAWTYTKDGKTVEMTASDTLNLYYVPYPANVTVKYRIVYDGEYLTEDSSTGSTVNVKDVIGKDFDEKTYTNVDLGHAADIEDFAVASGYADRYELVGIYHGSRFDKEKSIDPPKKIYYKNGELRINSADGPADDDGEIYVVYHNKANTMVEAGYATVANENDSIVTTMQEGKTYVDVPKGGSRDLTQPDYNNYDKYDIAVGSVSGETATVSQDSVTKLTANADGSVISVSGGSAFAADEILIYRYYEPRAITAYVFAYDWSGKRAYQRKETLNITADGITASGDNPGGKALNAQKLLSPVDGYELSEVYLLEDKGGNISDTVTPESESSVIDRNIANASEGIALTKTHGLNKIIAADDQALYFVYTPNFRTVEVRYLEWTENGYVPLTNYDKDVNVPLRQNIDFSSESVTYGDQTYNLIPTIDGYTPVAKNYLGASKDDLTELSSRTGENKNNGFYVKVDGSDKRVTNVQKIFYVYYPNPRTAYVHFVEKALNGDLVTIEGFRGNSLIVNVTAEEGLAMTAEGIEDKTVLTPDEETALATYSFVGAYVGGTAETEFADISSDAQTVTGRNLANELEGLTFEATTNPEASAMLLGNRDIYAVYYPEPRQVPVHAVVYDKGVLTVKDELLDGTTMISVDGNGTTVNKIDSKSINITDEVTGDTHTYSYKGMGVNYGPTAGGLDMDANEDSLTLKNSANGAQVMNGADVIDTLDMNDAVYYVFYPEPRQVNVYYVTLGADGKLTSVKKEGDTETAPVTSSKYEIGTSAADGDNSIKVDAVRTINSNDYDFKYIAAGPDMGIEYDENDNAVISTMSGDLAKITSGELYLKNEPASVKYSTQSSMADAEALTAAKPAIYIVYKPYIKLTVNKTVDGEYGDRTKDFEFTLSVDGAPSSASYKIKKSSSDTSSTVSNGGTFTLRHDESAELMLPKDAEITITETAVSGYTLEFGTNKPSGAALDDGEVTFTLGDTEDRLDIVNKFDDTKIVPSGIVGRHTPLFVAVAVLFLMTMAMFIWLRRRRRGDA